MQTVDREKDTVICDLDGTIALDVGRAYHLHPPHREGCSTPELTAQVRCDSCGRPPRNWEAYYSECGGDQPNWPVIDVLRLLWEDGYNIRILTGRRASTQAITEKWLREHAVPYHTLRMRPEGERLDDHILKLRWADEMGYFPSNVHIIFEDRQRVVDAWRSAGYTCFQVAPGNF